MSDMAYAVHTRTCTYLLDDDGICRWTLAPTGVVLPGADRCVGAQFVACLDLLAAGGLVGELRIGAAVLFARSENGRLVLLRTAPIEHVEYRGVAMAPAEPAPAEDRSWSLPDLPPYVPPATAPPPAYSAYVAPLPIPPSAPRQPIPTTPPPTVVLAPPAPVPRPSAPPAPVPRPSAPPAPRVYAPPAPVAPPAPIAYSRPEPPPRPAAISEPALEIDVEPEAEPEVIEELAVEDLVTFSEVTLTIPLYRPEAQPLTQSSSSRKGVVGPGRRLR